MDLQFFLNIINDNSAFHYDNKITYGTLSVDIGHSKHYFIILGPAKNEEKRFIGLKHWFDKLRQDSLLWIQFSQIPLFIIHHFLKKGGEIKFELSYFCLPRH